MNNTVESIRAAILAPENPARDIFGAPTYESADRHAKSIMYGRTLAIIAAQSQCPTISSGYLANLQSPSLSESVMVDSLRCLHGQLPVEQWDALYRAFIDSRGYSDGDLERFLS